ncbi:penicillin acylase family protein [Streptosporangium sp. NPDC001681]|uniref:penicillin acylase family protein n=1 Tax=Streptosporangium sp. NPDC001681 TaxID=3154395 RepID=UPI00331834A9
MESSWGQVRLSRDAYGTALVDADTEPAAYFGLGYAQAQDDLEALLRQYVLVRGETGDQERDATQRRWQVLEEARHGFDALPAGLRTCYEAFVGGVAAWMRERPDLVPAWAPPLEPALPIGVNRTAMLWWLITDAVEALREAGVLPTGPTSEKERMIGSNAWAIRPWRTAVGETILVSDPHLPLGETFAMHEAVVRGGEALHYTGFTFVGAMLPPLAHNRTCAWGLTTGGPRVSDAYRIVVDGDVYLHDGEPRQVLWHDGHEYVVHNDVIAPVLARDEEAVYVVCTPYMGLAGETELQLMEMVRARDVGELRAAQERQAFPPQNLIAADANGDCLYLRIGRTPGRAAGQGGRQVLDGNTSATAWKGIHPLAELVQIANPASGYLGNCNTAPDTVCPELRPDGWHPDAFNDEPGRTTSRGRRLAELLPRAYATDAAEVTRWALDSRWPDTALWQDRLHCAAEAAPDRIAGWPARTRCLLHRLLAFDGHADPGSTDALAWSTWRTALEEKTGELAEADLLDAVERAVVPDGTYGDFHELAPGVPGRAGGLGLDVPLRATYYQNGRAYLAGPCLRIVSFGTDGLRSWSVALPAQAGLYGRGEVKPITFDLP